MADLSGFDASKVEPNAPASVLPAGDYAVIISASETKPTKANDGEYLELRLQVCRGKHVNRVLFDRLNLRNANQQAVQIARGTLSAICRAVGVLTPHDSSELHGKPLLAVVGTRDYNGQPRNEVKGYKPLPEGWQPQESAFSAAASQETPW